MSLWISKWRVKSRNQLKLMYILLVTIVTDPVTIVDHLFSRLNFSVSVLKLRPLNGSCYDHYFSEHQSWAWSPYSRFRLNLCPLTGSNMLVDTGRGFNPQSRTASYQRRYKNGTSSSRVLLSTLTREIPAQEFR